LIALQNNKVNVEIYFSGRNFSAYIPLLPGCVATGATPNEVNRRIKEAVELHVKSSVDDGDNIPDIFRGDYKLIFTYNATL
jgi:predicted RNase H-like HicB family nuclease